MTFRYLTDEMTTKGLLKFVGGILQSLMVFSKPKQGYFIF